VENGVVKAYYRLLHVETAPLDIVAGVLQESDLVILGTQRSSLAI
jgi:hypothetical protein